MAVPGSWRAGALAAVAGLGLASCQVSAEYGPMQCIPSPPVPGSQFGFVDVSADIPLYAAPGGTFTITVNQLTAFLQQPDTGLFPHGALLVEGAVTPNGLVRVGKEPSSDTSPSYPQTLTFTATGQPGDVIHVKVDLAETSYLTDIPSVPVYTLTCNPGDPEIGTVTITAPDA
jgi:hypothetical protein